VQSRLLFGFKEALISAWLLAVKGIMSNILTDSLVMSKSNFNNLHEVPKLKLIRAEMVADSQNVDSLLSDAIHSLWVTNGSLSKAKLAEWMKQPTVRLSKSDRSKLESWINNFALDETKVAFEGSDDSRYLVGLESTRSLVESPLEADLKFNRGIQEYYLGKTKFQLTFEFNTASYRKTRARELVLRSKSLPVRLVRRIVN
jgi:hypothetical protein